MSDRTGVTYHQLRTFLAVARTGNLTRVARELNATQPTVSLQLQSLRKSLGITLFERPGGHFRLTPAGERLKRYAEEALGGLRLLQQELDVLKGSFAGPLQVGATFTVGRYVLPEALTSNAIVVRAPVGSPGGPRTVAQAHAPVAQNLRSRG